MEIALYLISNAFRIYVLYKFGKIFFEESKYPKYLFLIAYFLFYSINCIGFLLYNNLLINVLTNLIPYFFIFLLYQGRLWLKIVVPLLVYAMAMFCDGIIYKISTVLTINRIGFTSGFVTVLALYFMQLFLSKIVSVKIRNLEKVDLIYILTLIFVPIGSIIIGNLSLNTNNINGVLGCLILFGINILVFYLYDLLIKSQTSIRENEFYHQQQKYYQSQLELISQNHDRISCLRHDLKVHNQQIKRFLDTQNYSNLYEYIGKSDDLISSTENYIKTNNNDLDSLVNYKLALAVSLGTKITTNVNTVKSNFVEIFDMNTIVGNLLDNAIEALSAAEEKVLNLKIEFRDNIFALACQNTYSKLPNNEQQILKQDNLSRGYGIKSVNLAIKKYDGIMEIDVNEKYYKVKVILYKKNSSV